jgi:hypothetical protein
MKIHYIVAAAAVTCGLAHSSLVEAGQKMTREVVIVVTSTGRHASGSMGSARNSRDSVQLISCQLGAHTSGPATQGACVAKDATGRTASCAFFNKPQFESVLATISDDSFIHFYWDTSNQCTAISVYNSSAYEVRK